MAGKTCKAVAGDYLFGEYRGSIRVQPHVVPVIVRNLYRMRKHIRVKYVYVCRKPGKAIFLYFNKRNSLTFGHGAARSH